MEPRCQNERWQIGDICIYVSYDDAVRFEVIHRVFGVLATGDAQNAGHVTKLFAGVFRMFVIGCDKKSSFHIVMTVYIYFNHCQASEKSWMIFVVKNKDIFT
jgi:hypothetical protein